MTYGVTIDGRTFNSGRSWSEITRGVAVTAPSPPTSAGLTVYGLYVSEPFRIPGFRDALGELRDDSWLVMVRSPDAYVSYQFVSAPAGVPLSLDRWIRLRSNVAATIEYIVFCKSDYAGNFNWGLPSYNIGYGVNVIDPSGLAVINGRYPVLCVRQVGSHNRTGTDVSVSGASHSLGYVPYFAAQQLTSAPIFLWIVGTQYHGVGIEIMARATVNQYLIHGVTICYGSIRAYPNATYTYSGPWGHMLTNGD